MQVLVHVSTCFTNGMRRGRTAERPFEMNSTIGAELGWDNVPELDVQAGRPLRPGALKDLLWPQPARGSHGGSPHSLMPMALPAPQRQPSETSRRRCCRSLKPELAPLASSALPTPPFACMQKPSSPPWAAASLRDC
jgi:hypothetical protein